MLLRVEQRALEVRASVFSAKSPDLEPIQASGLAQQRDDRPRTPRVNREVGRIGALVQTKALFLWFSGP